MHFHANQRREKSKGCPTKDRAHVFVGPDSLPSSRILAGTGGVLSSAHVFGGAPMLGGNRILACTGGALSSAHVFGGAPILGGNRILVGTDFPSSARVHVSSPLRAVDACSGLLGRE